MMKYTRNLTKYAAGVCAFALCMTAASAQAATIIDENFQSQTAGSNPVALASSGTATPVGNVTTREDEPNGRIVQVVDSTTSPVDPFGPAGNKSLQLYSESTTATSVFFRSSSPGIASGALSMNMMVTTTPTPGDVGPWFSVILGGTASNTFLGGNGTDGLARIDFRSDSSILIRANGGNFFADQTYTANTNYLLNIEFDANTHLFSISLNGSPLTTGGGTANSWTTLSTSLTSANALQVYGAASGTSTIRTGEAFVDNILLTDVPEPASMALLAAGGLLITTRRRR